MLRRLLVGMFIGLVVGALLTAALVKGLGVVSFASGSGGALAYVFAAVTGVLTGLFAGKPIWAQGGKIEAGLKGAFGALIASGFMFAMRRWGSPEVSFGALASGPVGSLPITTIPVIAALLGGFYGADNTPEEGDGKGAAGKKDAGKKAPAKEAAKTKGKRVADESPELEDEELESPPKKAKR